MVCETEGGDSANVREVYGSWKMLTGYDVSRSPEELEHNYDVLVVQTGGAICRVSYVSKMPMETAFTGLYEHSVKDKKLTIGLLQPVQEEVTAKYSFAGSCSDATMTLRYNNGAVEKYQFRSKDVGDGCPGFE